ncbi:pentapeptide repeat-containing protein [Ruminococcus champanellensis]
MGRIKGYKVFGPGWICDPAGTPFQYAVGETYEMEEVPIVCERGFHFCERAVDCFNYYGFDPKNKVAEIEALGDIDSDGSKSCTNKIHIIREIPWKEILDLVNTGNGCTGMGNSGNWNSGDWNSCSYSSGCFNTIEHKMFLFNKLSDWTYHDWIRSDARRVLSRIPHRHLKPVSYDSMSDMEKEANPEAKTTGTFLRIVDNPDVQNWWRSISDEDKKAILSIPNFNKAIFKEITGVDVDKN